jgi:hypothetical protein
VPRRGRHEPSWVHERHGWTPRCCGWAIPVLGAGAILVVAAAAIAHVDLLARVASEPPAVQWSVLLLALAGYLDVRAIAGALSRTPEPDESSGAEDLVQTWEVPSKRTQFMFGTGVGAVIGVASVLMPAVPLVTLAALAGTLGPISLPLLVVGGRLSWRFYTYSIRFFGRMQVGARKRTSIVSRQSRRPDVLYLRSFPTDRWRVSAEAIRHPAGRFGRPPFEEVVLRLRGSCRVGRHHHLGSSAAAQLARHPQQRR